MDDLLMSFAEPPPAAEMPVPQSVPIVMGDTMGNFILEASPASCSPPMPAAYSPPMPGYADPFLAEGLQGATVSPLVPVAAQCSQTNPLRQWEEEHARILEDVARKESDDKETRRMKAEQDLKKWYEENSTSRQRRQSSNRTEEHASEAARMEAMAPGTNPWEHVVDLIDTNAKTADVARDTSRMRSLLIQLKSDPAHCGA